jgi:hypothetical protein
LCLKSQIPSTKLQINLKFQYSTRGASACAARVQDLARETLFGFSNFGHWKLVDIWDFHKTMNFQQSKTTLSEI